MKFKVLNALLFSIIVIFSSCKNEKSNEMEPINETINYSQLKVGNYWIYERFKIDTNGIATSQNIYDSCYVEKDTLINNKKFFKVVRPLPYPGVVDYSYQRDSLHYIVNSNSEILFSSQDFISIFSVDYILATTSDTVCKIIRKMNNINQTITVPAGLFVTLNARETFLMYPNWSFNGNRRMMHRRFANNVGIVSETFPFYVSMPTYVERRLVRYNLK